MIFNLYRQNKKIKVGTQYKKYVAYRTPITRYSVHRVDSSLETTAEGNPFSGYSSYSCDSLTGKVSSYGSYKTIYASNPVYYFGSMRSVYTDFGSTSFTEIATGGIVSGGGAGQGQLPKGEAYVEYNTWESYSYETYSYGTTSYVGIVIKPDNVRYPDQDEGYSYVATLTNGAIIMSYGGTYYWYEKA